MYPTIAPAELASWLGYASADYFQEAARKLSARYGFPRKLPGRPLWSRKAVLQWIERQGGVEPALALSGAPTFEPSDEDFEVLRRELEARYCGDGLSARAARAGRHAEIEQ